MVDFDSAFLWETEALRSSPPRRARPVRHPHRDQREDPTWVTLREGHEKTGIPVSTLRKWAIGGSVPTFLDETPVGEVRMVSLQGIYRRAAQLGRVVHGEPPSVSEPATPGIAVHRPQPKRQGESADVPPGTTLVPLDAWNKMLLQLGNLHEAGQQLAEASARAARAETEAAFLKERLAELRDELARARGEVGSNSAGSARGESEVPQRLGFIRQMFAARRGREHG